jgi:hypothetical protein
MTLLFVMASPEYLRYYDSTIRLLADRGHTVLLAVNQQKDAKPVRLEDHGLPGTVRLLGLVAKRRDRWSRMARLVRGAADYVRYLHPRFAQTPALRERMSRKGLPRSLRWIDSRLGVCSNATVGRLLRLLAAIERGIPVSAAVERFLLEHRPDLVLVSPLVDAASDQVDMVRAARRLGTRVAAGIASWDNLTNKGLLRVEPDAVLVWNEAQKREAVEMHGIDPAKVVVTGAQLFDRWFHKTPGRSLAAFAERVGLARAERFILFTGSSMFISSPEAEVAFVRRWLEAMRGSAHAVLRETPILIRPHPYNGWIWADVDVSGFHGVAVWPRGRYNAIDAGNRDDYFDSLYYSRAVVGINTSAMVEAAIIGRPVHSIVTGDFARTQEGTLHFHHLLPEHGGFLRVGHGLDRHADLLAASLADEAGAIEETGRFVRWFLRPHGVDRDCTPIFADALERLAAAPPRPDPPAGAGARLLAWTLLPLANVLTRSRVPDEERGQPLWKRAAMFRHRAAKRASGALKHAARRGQRLRKAVRARLRALRTSG